MPKSEIIILSRVSLTVMQIELWQDKVYEKLLKIKPVKATGPDMVFPKLLELADQTIVPSFVTKFWGSWRNLALDEGLFK